MTKLDGLNIYLRNKGDVVVSIVLVAVWTGSDRLREIGLVVGHRHRTFVICDIISRIDRTVLIGRRDFGTLEVGSVSDENHRQQMQ